MKIISTAERPINLLEIIGGSTVGGTEIHVLQLIQNLPRDLFHITCLCVSESSFTSRLRELGCEVHLTSMTDETDWQSIQLGASLVRAVAVDVIHAHLPNAHLLAGIVSRLTEIPALATVHGRYLGIRDLEIHKLMQTNICAVCKSAYFQAIAIGVPASKLRYIPNAVDTHVFCPGPRKGYLHGQLGIPPDTPLVGFVGRLSSEKGPSNFIKIASIAHNSVRDCHFVLVGEGPLYEKLEKDIDNLGMNTFIHLAGLQTDMPAVYDSLDLVVSTSHSEAMPLAILEAMASGLPVIVTNVGGMIDIVEEDRTGFLNSFDDFDGIARNIATLMSDSALRGRMGSAGRKRVEKDFELSNSVSQISELLKSLAQTGSTSERTVERG